MTATGHLPTEVTGVAAAAIVAFASLVIAAGAVTSLFQGRQTGRQLATHIGIGLEFFLAAGLIRLASADSFKMLGVAASIIAVRRAIVMGLGYSARAAG